MTGQQLFDAWVSAGLCFDTEYRWDMLTTRRQDRWNNLAATLKEQFKC